MLTNGMDWQIHKVTVKGMVTHEQVFEFSFENLNLKKTDHLDMLFSLCKRGVERDLIDDFYQYKQSVNRYTVGAILMSEPALNLIRKELKRLNDGIKVSAEELAIMLEHEILKLDLIDSEETLKAKKQIARQNRAKKTAKKLTRDNSAAASLPMLPVEPGKVSRGTHFSS